MSAKIYVGKKFRTLSLTKQNSMVPNSFYSGILICNETFSKLFILPNCLEMMVNHVKNKVQAKTCPLVTKKWTNQESEPTICCEWHRKPYAESFITIRPQIAKLWPKMVSPWWPKNELIKKMTPPSVVDGKTVLTLWISLDLANRRPSYGPKWYPPGGQKMN